MADRVNWEEALQELRRRERSRTPAGRSSRTGREPAAAKRRRPSGRRGGDSTPAGRLAAASSDALLKQVRRGQRVVYGVDNRKEIHKVARAAVRKAADSVAALVRSRDLAANADGSWTLTTTSYRDEYELCSSEPFASQPLGCFCSGFLVASDVIATAGHCVKSAASLATMRFVFGFRVGSDGKIRTVFPAADVYRGTELIGRRLTEGGADWALVRLDRAPAGRTPLSVRTRGKVGRGELSVIGHPNGLPAKYANGAHVRDNDASTIFSANLDTYGGNSGSPVFDDRTLRVEGILVRGETDFVSKGDCNVSLVCPDGGCRGEDVTRSTVWASKIPAAPKAAPRKRRRRRS